MWSVQESWFYCADRRPPEQQKHRHMAGFTTCHDALIATFSTVTSRPSGVKDFTTTASGLWLVPQHSRHALFRGGDDGEPVTQAVRMEVFLNFIKAARHQDARLLGRFNKTGLLFLRLQRSVRHPRMASIALLSWMGHSVCGKGMATERTSAPCAWGSVRDTQ